MSHILYNWFAYHASNASLITALLSVERINTTFLCALGWIALLVIIGYLFYRHRRSARPRSQPRPLSSQPQQPTHLGASLSQARALPPQPSDYASSYDEHALDELHIDHAAGTPLHGQTLHSNRAQTNRSQGKRPSNRVYRPQLGATVTLNDSLTGLPNRHVLEIETQKLLNQPQTQPGAALLLINIDNLGHINDTYSHAVGDILLQCVAWRLQRLVKPKELLVRLNSNKFTLLIKELPKQDEPSQPHKQNAEGQFNKQSRQTPQAHAITTEQHAYLQDIAENIQKSHEAPYLIGGIALQGRSSIGIVPFDSSTVSPLGLIQKASLALNQARALRGANIRFYDRRLSQQLKESQLLAAELPFAIERQQLAVYAHPQHSVDGVLLGVELLMRWQHPTLGNISPDRFIPLAEKENLIHQLGLWMLEQAKTFITENPIDWLSVSVNVSPLQFHSDHFVDFIRFLTDHTTVMGPRLVVELTEGTIMENVKEAKRMMQFLNRLGYRFSLDDFGTGYSNLAAISSFPLFEIKLDRSLVKNIAQDKQLRTIAGLVASLSKNLHLRSIAEGVENAEDLAVLKALQFDAVQGFYFAQPMPLSHWPAFLAQARLPTTQPTN